MNIREDSKKVIRYILGKAIDCGDLLKEFPIQYHELACELNFSNENYLRVCCQYLHKKGYISIRLSMDATRQIHETMNLQASAVDFLEGEN